MLEIEEMAVSRLSPWEQNPRVNEHAVKAVARSVASFGFNVPILCDQDLTIIAGHTRWKAAKILGLATVPVIRLTMSDSQRKAFAVADNKTAELADWDFPKLREVLEELRTEDVSLADLGFSDEELRHLLAAETKDEDELPETCGQPKAKSGDVWRLGKHLLLCGDSREKDLLVALAEGCVVDHVFAGSPCFNQKDYAHWDSYYSGHIIDCILGSVRV
jgi:site-specific DNA-methyltransferase (adenine-specific)